MKLLLTGFEPFGGETINPAQEALALVPDRIGTLKIVKLILPVVFGTSIAAIRAALREHRPDAVLCIGQAGGRMEATPERVALNLNDARIPDNDKNQPVDEPTSPRCPSRTWSPPSAVPDCRLASPTRRDYSSAIR